MYIAEKYLLAESPEQAAELLRSDKKNAILGGGMWMRTLNSRYNTLIDISSLGLDYIRDDGDLIRIGAMTTLRQAETSPLLFAQYGDVLRRSLASIVGVQFRNMATVGGSVYGKYAFSDVLTALLALDASVVFQNLGTIPLETYLSSATERDLLLEVCLPADSRRAAYETHRLTKTDFGILNVCTAKLRDGSYRISVGSRPGRPVRCKAAEALLAQGKTEDAMKAVQELSYTDCIRSSGDYRRALAPVLTRRCLAALEEAAQ